MKVKTPGVLPLRLLCLFEFSCGRWINRLIGKGTFLRSEEFQRHFLFVFEELEGNLLEIIM